MEGIIMGCETNATTGDHVLLVVPLVSVVMSTNPVRRKYSRHIDIRRHYAGELALAVVVKLVPLSTHDMVPEALTKCLPHFFF